MHSLVWEIKQVMSSNRDGSYSTQQSRLETFKIIANESKEVGYRRITLDSLSKEKCIRAYVDHWKQKGLSPATIKNRLSHVRWCASKKNNKSRVPSNQKLEIENRVYIANVSKACRLEQKHLDLINNQFIKDTLRLQAAFGLRREEAIKFNPFYADKGDKIKLKAPWCKGGLSREIPINTKEQRTLLDELKERYGNNSLIPADKTYKQQKDTYKNIVPKIGLEKKGHGLRHQYIQDRYKELSGNNCPVNGGKHQKEMTSKEREKDREVRLRISKETGHSREQITSTYLGS